MADKQPLIDWVPAPGCVLVKPVKREELAALYNRSGASTLSLPDKVGKVSDSVGVGKVMKLGGFKDDDALIELVEGDYIAHIPYVDLLIEIDGIKYSLVPYDKIMAIRKGA